MKTTTIDRQPWRDLAIRIARAAADMGIATVSVFSEDDATSLHTRRSDDSRALKGIGPAAYLDIAQIIGVAKESGLRCRASWLRLSQRER